MGNKNKDLNKKTRQVNILLSPLEFYELSEVCENESLKISTYVRKLVIDKLKEVKLK